MMSTINPRLVLASLALIAGLAPLAAQTDVAKRQSTSSPPQAGASGRAAPAAPAIATMLPPYVIGPSDVLSIVFWRDKDMSADVLVRPDGNITLPLLNDIQAAGLTPAALRERILIEARRYL